MFVEIRILRRSLQVNECSMTLPRDDLSFSFPPSVFFLGGIMKHDIDLFLALGCMGLQLFPLKFGNWIFHFLDCLPFSPLSCTTTQKNKSHIANILLPGRACANSNLRVYHLMFSLQITFWPSWICRIDMCVFI